MSKIKIINNYSKKTIHLILFSPDIKRSFDVVLGPEKICNYSELYRFENESAPIPQANNQDDFKQSHIRLRVGENFYAIFQKSNDSIVLVTPDSFNGQQLQTVPNPNHEERIMTLLIDSNSIPRLK